MCLCMCICVYVNVDFGVTLEVKNPPAKAGTVRDIPSLGWEDALEKEMQPTPVFLPGQSHGQRNLVGYSP